jgi:hypothetical protein
MLLSILYDERHDLASRLNNMPCTLGVLPPPGGTRTAMGQAPLEKALLFDISCPKSGFARGKVIV